MSIAKFKFSTEVQVADISNTINKNYGYVMTEFLELQRGWLFRAYSVFKDLDKYLILMNLIDKTFKSYSEYLIKYNYDEFYSVNDTLPKEDYHNNIYEYYGLEKPSKKWMELCKKNYYLF